MSLCRRSHLPGAWGLQPGPSSPCFRAEAAPADGKGAPRAAMAGAGWEVGQAPAPAPKCLRSQYLSFRCGCAFSKLASRVQAALEVSPGVSVFQVSMPLPQNTVLHLSPPAVVATEGTETLFGSNGATCLFWGLFAVSSQQVAYLFSAGKDSDGEKRRLLPQDGTGGRRRWSEPACG